MATTASMPSAPSAPSAPAPTAAAAAAAAASGGPVVRHGPAASQMPGYSPQNASLYVGDLAPSVGEPELFAVFNIVGSVSSIRVCREAMTRRSLGYAYVNFHSPQDAERAIEALNFSLIKGRPCRIMWSQRDPYLRKSGKGNIFVKNLHESVDHKTLYDTFSLFGDILSCKVAVDTAGKSKGYGYVHFTEEESAKKAIEKVDGMVIEGLTVYVGPFQRRNERRSASEWTNCYTKNLPVEWDEPKLTEVFAAHGNVTSVIIKRNDDGSSKGFGFVNFEKPEEAAAAVEALNGMVLEGEGEEKAADKPEEATASAEGAEGAAEKEESKDDKPARRLYVGRAQKKAERMRELREQYESKRQERMSKLQGVNLYIKNLDDSVDDAKLRAEFGKIGPITSAKVMKDRKDVSKGFGFVCFASPEDATKAVADMNGSMINGKPVYVAFAQRKEVRRAQMEAQYARGMGAAMGRGGMMPGQYPGMPMGAPPMYYQGMPGAMGGPGGYMGAGGFAGQAPFGVMGGRGGGGRGGGARRGPGGRGGPGMGGPGMGGPMPGRAGYPAAPGYPTAGAPAPTAAAPPAAPAVGGGAPALTAEALANASPELRLNMIGERLFPLVQARQPQLAAKITGMLLEMDQSELLNLLESPPALEEKIEEALRVLQAHRGERTA